MKSSMQSSEARRHLSLCLCVCVCAYVHVRVTAFSWLAG